MNRADYHQAISIEGVTKRYRLGGADASTLREAISFGGTRLMSAMTGRSKKGPLSESDQTFWALKGVSLAVEHGEMVGIVGNNGAGKSTLLKILSRITPPTEGSVRFRGRIGSLLEVGTGFHPELSGRDNIFLNGAILGMRRHEIAKRFDEIVAFAETEAFIDTPVKRYSSGMYLRLAFAVAAHLDADILLVDEVLAVGDVAFQKKCLARMSDVAHTGRTVLFVSHNLTAVQALCQRTIWLDKGLVAADGETRDVLSRYLRSSSGFGSSTNREWPAGSGPVANGIELRRALIFPTGGKPEDPIDVKSNFRLEFQFASKASVAAINLSIQLVDEQGVLIFDAGPQEEPKPWAKGLHTMGFEIPCDLLNDGAYRFGLEIYEGGQTILQLPELLTLDILDSDVGRHGWFGKWAGVIRPQFRWDHSIDQA